MFSRGRWRGGFLQDEFDRRGLIRRPPGGSEAHFPVRNLFAVLFEHFVGQLPQTGARHGAQEVFEIVAAHLACGKQLGMQPSRRFSFAGVQGFQHPEGRRALRRRGWPEGLRRAIGGSAEIADAAIRTSVGQIAEMTHQGRHAALVGSGEADHLLDLRPLLLALGDVGLAPVALAGAHVLGVVHHGPAVDPQLLEGLVEQVGIHPHLAAQSGLFHRLGPQLREQRVQHGHVRVVALEEEIVRVAIRVGVHQNRAARLAVAPGSPNLLVVRLQAARQGGMDHGADIGFVDAHPKGDGRRNHLHLARHKSLPRPLAMLGVQARMIGRGGEALAELRRDALGLLAGGGIHNARAARLVQQQLERQRGPFRRRHFHHFNGDVGAAESVDEARRPVEAQLLGDIVLDQRRGGGGEGNHGGRTQRGQVLA